MPILTGHKENLSYQSAIDELRIIVNSIENGEIGIDKLSEQINVPLNLFLSVKRN